METLGLPHARAGVAGSQGALLTGKAILADGVSVVGQAFAGALKDLIGTNVQIAQRSQLHALAVMLGRRGIERASAWKREMPPSPENREHAASSPDCSRLSASITSSPRK